MTTYYCCPRVEAAGPGTDWTAEQAAVVVANFISEIVHAYVLAKRAIDAWLEARKRARE